MNIKVNEKIKSLRAIESTKKTRNRQVYEQALLIGLLNKYCNMMFRKTRHGNVCDDFLRTDRISFNNDEDEINVSSFLRQRAMEIYQNDLKEGVNEKTAKRRMQVNRRIEAIHLCIDILSTYGYHFDMCEPKGKAELRRIDYIRSIHYDNKNININDDKLKELNKVLNDKIQNGVFNILTMNDNDIQKLIERL